ncbi:hypothetical protein [Dictyobacter formicarum]|uniref:Uncharacterized protein n=1 Tax=Dictyobacter formicarum TaxID=2778368 RepID=A0ABQ3VAX0_9CHLR|nr:hypothetical protein [Dictyobacter formicarum]GHO82563.1 hypothetical protein KSZ_05690 [Dictyobacter formicarum]
MCSGMMFGMFFWWIFGPLLFLALIAAVIWLLVRAFRAPRQPSPPWPQEAPQPYQRSAPVPGTAETYEEGGRAYPYPEQPSPQYPHAPAEQQEQRRRF